MPSNILLNSGTEFIYFVLLLQEVLRLSN